MKPILVGLLCYTLLVVVCECSLFPSPKPHSPGNLRSVSKFIPQRSGGSSIRSTYSTRCNLKVLVVSWDAPDIDPLVMNHVLASGHVIPENVDSWPLDASGDFTAADLVPYDVVFWWAPFPPGNPDPLGDALADFVDGGGSVVLMGQISDWIDVFEDEEGNPFSIQKLTIPSARFLDYMPFEVTQLSIDQSPAIMQQWDEAGYIGFAPNLLNAAIAHPILADSVVGGQVPFDAGKSHYAGISYVTVAQDAILLASYQPLSSSEIGTGAPLDPIPAIAVKQLPGKGTVVGIQALPITQDDYWFLFPETINQIFLTTGQSIAILDQMIGNSIVFAAGGSEVQCGLPDTVCPACHSIIRARLCANNPALCA